MFWSVGIYYYMLCSLAVIEWVRGNWLYWGLCHSFSIQHMCSSSTTVSSQDQAPALLSYCDLLGLSRLGQSAPSWPILPNKVKWACFWLQDSPGVSNFSKLIEVISTIWGVFVCIHYGEVDSIWWQGLISPRSMRLFWMRILRNLPAVAINLPGNS